MTESDRLLADMKQRLDRHFGLVDANPVKPEHRPSQDTLTRFAELCREDDTAQKVKDLEAQVKHLQRLAEAFERRVRELEIR